MFNNISPRYGWKWSSLLTLVSLVTRISGESVTLSVLPVGSSYISPPVGLGYGGGNLTISISLTDHDAFAVNVVSLLSEEQYGKWKNSVDDIASHDTRFEAEAMVASYSAQFHRTFNRTVALSSALPERYFVVITYPYTEGQTVFPTGELSVDWRQHGGSYLQYQLHSLVDILPVLRNVILMLSFIYVLSFSVGLTHVTRLHIFHLFVLLYAAVLIQVWIDGTVAETKTGSRYSWTTKWFPALVEKSFDILEIVMYMLTSLGWQSLRESLLPSEIQLIAIGSGLSLLLGLLETACGEDEAVCGSYTSARLVIHVFGLLVAITAFTATIAHLDMHLRESSIASAETGKKYILRNQFGMLKNVCILFILQPTLTLAIRTDILDWTDESVFQALFWATKIFLLAAVAFTFRPRLMKMPLVDLAIKERRRARRLSTTPP